MTPEELAASIRAAVHAIRDVQVTGEVGRVHTSSSSHQYFEISDPEARLGCVAWSGSGVQPRAGMATLHVKRVDFYAAHGRCQLVVSAFEPHAAEGTAAQRRKLLVDALRAEGVLDRPRLPLPGVVRHLCIITSRGSAAEHDVLHGVRQRWEGLRTTLIAATVQGHGAPAQLAAAFALARTLRPDVIVCTRGGGSEGDLDTFNDERVVRACAASDVPVVCAIGHESDHCLTEDVADLRAKTPTAAIEAALPTTREDAHAALRALRARARAALAAVLARRRCRVLELRAAVHAAARRTLRAAERSLRARRPALEALLRRAVARAAHRAAALRASAHGAVAAYRRAGDVQLQQQRAALREAVRNCARRHGGRVAALRLASRAAAGAALADAVARHAARRRARDAAAAACVARHAAALRALRQRLEALAPRHGLRRGVAWVWDERAALVRDAAAVDDGTTLCVQMHDAILEVVVKRKRARVG